KKSYTGKSIIKTAGKRYLKIPKLGYVKTSKTGVLQNTKINESTGKYYLSLQVEISEPEKYSLTGKRVGIDVGVADLAILSNGLKYPSFNSSYFEKKAKV
ncbi:transposase, partial [Lactobacillus helveticus]|nr:transposase [Lactobacillus helveticus]